MHTLDSAGTEVLVLEGDILFKVDTTKVPSNYKLGLPPGFFRSWCLGLGHGKRSVRCNTLRGIGHDQQEEGGLLSHNGGREGM